MCKSEVIRDAATLAVFLHEEAPERYAGVIAGDVLALIAAEAVLRRLAVKQCNTGELSTREQNRESRIAAEIAERMKPYNLKGVKIGGDVRGSQIHLMLKSDRYNTMGGRETGWAV